MADIPLNVDPAGFVWYDGAKLPFRIIRSKGIIEFIDKDRRRSEKRGSRFLAIPLEEFEKIIRTNN